MKTELHCHTTVSDGSLTFEEVLLQAEAEGITSLAVTNHDTTKDLIEMMEAGKAKGVEIIPGIEISAYDFQRERRVHILGYWVEPGNETIEQLCGPLVVQRHEASRLMAEKLVQAGYEISWEEAEALAEGGTGVYKQHLMHLLIEKGYTSEMYGPLYKELFSRDGGSAYIPLKYVSADEAVKAILAAGGVPVLAHPGQYGNFAAVPELVEAGLQGIEVWHPLHEEEDEERAMVLAEQYGLVMTGGSDFHGAYGEKETVLGSKDPGREHFQLLKDRHTSLREVKK
ncbi:PHP domain-containing protein [Bacillus mangrovi]|uniref:PHP domain-containing protein n=1 Tax=Metabacillus mangrovi TaxID=1491830 RepID=A0A7X2S5D6_9BACI|nr:PHP domain-containing protein [Metabacillus mangrovi]MTH53516.1 PHP domain-containing protein [Metabacillus mangrovi]